MLEGWQDPPDNARWEDYRARRRLNPMVFDTLSAEIERQIAGRAEFSSTELGRTLLRSLAAPARMEPGVCSGQLLRHLRHAPQRVAS